MSAHLGIDPGRNGAMWCVDLRSGECAFADMPYIGPEPDFCAVHAWILDTNHKHPLASVTLEKQWARPSDAKANAFRTGQAYGALRMALASLEIPYQLVSPQKWKADVGLLRADKNASRALATQLLPRYADCFSRVKDDGRAEAALMALRAAGVFSMPERVSA